MTKSTPDVSSCFVFKSSPESFISLLFIKNSSRRGGGQCAPPRLSSHLGAMLPHIIWLALGFLPSYAPGAAVMIDVRGTCLTLATLVDAVRVLCA